MIEEKVKLSIIVPIYKGRQYISGIVEMIKRNVDKAKNIVTELIFVDDYPTEKMEDLNENHHNLIIKTIHNERNFGIHRTRVNGLKESKGEYVLFLDQDDIISDDYIYSQMSSIGENDLVLCNGKFRNNQLIYTETRRQELAFERDYFIRTLGFIISPGQIVLRKRIIPKIWINKPIIHNGNDDSLLWSLLVANGIEVAINRKVIYIHVETGENNSSNGIEMIESKRETVRWLEKEKIFSDCERLVYKQTVDKFIEKYRAYIIFDSLFQEGYKPSEYMFNKYNSKNIAVYGAGVYGRKLGSLLCEHGINVHYYIDANNNAMSDKDINIYGTNDDIPSCDYLIVTPVQVFDEIKEKYAEKFEEIVRLDDFVEGLMSQ